MVFEIKQEKFEGPLELLLDLVEQERLGISEVSLARVAEEYLAHVRALGSPDPEELAEFLLVAAQLMLIKSRSLLPGLAVPVEDEESLEELAGRLRLLQRLRDAARGIKNLEYRRRWMESRPAYQNVAPAFHPPPGIGPDLLAQAFAAVVSLIPKVEKLTEEKLRRIVSLEERILHVRRILQDAVERGFSEIVRGAREKIEIIVSFLAILELARQKAVDLHQDEAFSDITIRPFAQ